MKKNVELAQSRLKECFLMDIHLDLPQMIIMILEDISIMLQEQPSMQLYHFVSFPKIIIDLLISEKKFCNEPISEEYKKMGVRLIINKCGNYFLIRNK